METIQENEALDAIGKNTWDCIAEMVAALQCDYDRLEELKEARDEGNGPVVLNESPWGLNHPKDAAELNALLKDAGDCEDADAARQVIDEDPLSVEVGGWWTLDNKPEPQEYRILLGTGGPATRIVGDLGQGNEPSTAWLEVQDWGTPWRKYTGADQDVLMAYVGCFYFGE